MADLSMKCGVNLMEASMNLKNRETNPTDTNMEIGTRDGKFYLINFNLGKIERITYGAFKHCREAWANRRMWRDYPYPAA